MGINKGATYTSGPGNLFWILLFDLLLSDFDDTANFEYPFFLKLFPNFCIIFLYLLSLFTWEILRIIFLCFLSNFSCHVFHYNILCFPWMIIVVCCFEWRNIFISMRSLAALFFSCVESVYFKLLSFFPSSWFLCQLRSLFSQKLVDHGSLLLFLCLAVSHSLTSRQPALILFGIVITVINGGLCWHWWATCWRNKCKYG